MRKSFGVFVLSAFSLAGVRAASAAPNGYVSTPFADQVVVFDTADNSIVTTVDVGEFPRGLAVSPNGNKVYVANQGDDTNNIASSISVIDTANNTAGTPIVTSANGTTKTAFVVFSPDGSKAYASNGGTDEGAPGLRPYYHPNYYGAYVRDPDGNWIELSQRASIVGSLEPG